MNFAVIGSGGREHALCYKLKQSPKLKKLICIPGNAGTEKIAKIEVNRIINFLFTQNRFTRTEIFISVVKALLFSEISMVRCHFKL